MRNDKENVFTLKQHIYFIFRGLKTFGTFSKPIFLSKTISIIFNAGAPFINIYFIGQILNELTSGRDQKRLISLFLTTIILNLVISLVGHVIKRWSLYCDSMSPQLMNKIYADKLLSMDHIDIEDPIIQQKYSEIRQHQNGMGFGLPRFKGAYEGIVTGIVQIVLSSSLAFSLFTSKVPEYTKFLYLNSPLVMFVMLMILFCSIFASLYLFMKGEKIWATASNNKNKDIRVFDFYFEQMTRGSDKAKDIRVYNQKKMIEKGALWCINNKNIRHEYAKYNGRFFALGTGISYLVNGFIYLFVALKAYAGAIGVGGIVQYVGAITQFVNGITSIITNIGTLINNNVFLNKSFVFLDITNKKQLGSLSIAKLDDKKIVIEFNNSYFDLWKINI